MCQLFARSASANTQDHFVKSIMFMTENEELMKHSGFIVHAQNKIEVMSNRNMEKVHVF